MDHRWIDEGTGQALVAAGMGKAGGGFCGALPAVGMVSHVPESIAGLTPKRANRDRTCPGDTLDRYRIMACDSSVNRPGAKLFWVLLGQTHLHNEVIGKGAGRMAAAALVTKLEGIT
jgi:hypothetical protein